MYVFKPKDFVVKVIEVDIKELSPEAVNESRFEDIKETANSRENLGFEDKITICNRVIHEFITKYDSLASVLTNEELWALNVTRYKQISLNSKRAVNDSEGNIDTIDNDSISNYIKELLNISLNEWREEYINSTKIQVLENELVQLATNTSERLEELIADFSRPQIYRFREEIFSTIKEKNYEAIEVTSEENEYIHNYKNIDTSTIRKVIEGSLFIQKQ